MNHSKLSCLIPLFVAVGLLYPTSGDRPTWASSDEGSPLAMWMHGHSFVNLHNVSKHHAALVQERQQAEEVSSETAEESKEEHATMRFAGFPKPFDQFFDAKPFVEDKDDEIGGRSTWTTGLLENGEEPFIYWCWHVHQPMWVLAVKKYTEEIRQGQYCRGYATLAGDPAELVHVDRVFWKGKWVHQDEAPWVNDIKVDIVTTKDGGEDCDEMIDTAGWRFKKQVKKTSADEHADKTFGKDEEFVCMYLFSGCPAPCNYGRMKEMWKTKRNETKALLKRLPKTSSAHVLFPEVNTLVDSGCLGDLHTRCIKEGCVKNSK
jgi:hypothetical protein